MNELDFWFFERVGFWPTPETKAIIKTLLLQGHLIKLSLKSLESRKVPYIKRITPPHNPL